MSDTAVTEQPTEMPATVETIEATWFSAGPSIPTSGNSGACSW
jgi:hypothetical protein